MIKDFVKFIVLVVIILSAGIVIGVGVGRKHPAESVQDEWLSNIRNEVNLLQSTYSEMEEEYRFGIELRDSIITALKREIAKGDGAEIPIKVNINVSNDDGK